MGLLISTNRMSATSKNGDGDGDGDGDSGGNNSPNRHDSHSLLSSSSQDRHQQGRTSRMRTVTGKLKCCRKKRTRRSVSTGSSSSSSSSTSDADGMHDDGDAPSHSLDVTRTHCKKRQKRDDETDGRIQTGNECTSQPQQREDEDDDDDGDHNNDAAAASLLLNWRRSAFTAELLQLLYEFAYERYYANSTEKQNKKQRRIQIMERIAGMIEEDSKRPIEQSLIDLNRTPTNRSHARMC